MDPLSPIACVLGALAPDEQEREHALLERVRSAVTRSERTAGGYRLHFAHGETLLAAIGELIALERLGFRVEGLAQDYLRIDGEWRGHVLTALVRPEWREP